MARPLHLMPVSRASRWGVLLPAWGGAGPALAGLPEGMASPWVTLGAGMLMMSFLAGSAYVLWLRQRVARLEGLLAAPALSVLPVGSEAAPAEGPDHHFRLAAEGFKGVEGWIDPDGKLYWVNQAVEHCTGYSTQDVMAGDFIDLLVYERDRHYCREQVHQALASGVPSEFEVRLVTKAGSLLWMACHWQPIRSAAGVLLGLRALMSDIQARKEAEYKLLESVAALRRAQALSEHYVRRSDEERSRLSALLDVVRMGILFLDVDRRVVFCNRTLYDIWGLPQGDSFVGMRDVVLQEYAAPLLQNPQAYAAHIADVLAGRQPPGQTFEIQFLDGRVVTDFSRIVRGPGDGRPIGRMWVFEDVTEQRQVAAQLMRLAERDPLTNLFNRRRFHEELERMLADGGRHGEFVGLLAIDLDGFKPVNDRYGHQAGDEVLVGLASAVSAGIRRNEMFFRLGGDEFAILVPSARGPALVELARRVSQCIAGLCFSFAGQTVSVSASIGIALGSRDGQDGEALVGAADRAMYLAKARGGNGWELAPEPAVERLA